ncbi:MAG: hypothetical protein WBA97_01380 [Actinophytocola sp.]|uniref:hypothetical protein n=1 Tax=Actinophytocola sp. TaxID=1872138 RepID=UPI003C79043B
MRFAFVTTSFSRRKSDGACRENGTAATGQPCTIGREGDIVEDRELSQAIVTYIGKGRSAFPLRDEDAVAASSAGADPSALLAKVRAIVSECMSLEVDWSAHSLVEGGREAERFMAARHPDLGRDALDALSWTFMYDWR